MDDLDYILGRQLAEQIRQSPVISDQVISSLIKDMLGADLSLLVPLRDLMSQPSLEQAIRLGVHENPSLLRDSLLTALSSTYQPEIICRLHNVLNGSLNLQAEQGKIQTVDLRNAASITAAPSESLSASYYQQPQPHIGPITTKNRNPLPRSSILLFSFLVGGLLTVLIVLITMVAQMQQQKTAESPSTNVRLREEPTTVEPKLSPLGTNYVPDPDESLNDLADEIFWRKYPSLRGEKLINTNGVLATEWKQIRKCDAVVDQAFYRIYPEMRGRTIDPANSEMVKVWKRIASTVAGCR